MKILNNIISIGTAMLLFSVLYPSSVAAQNSPVCNNKGFYSFERIEQITPWLKSGNGASLVFNATPDNFSGVSLNYNNENGDFRNYNQAKKINGLGIGTKSYSRINNLYFYGLFNYKRDVKTDQAWLGNIDENSELASMVEDIPGKAILEEYYLDGGLGYKISDTWSLGFNVNYRDAAYAKRRDGRNKNILSNLSVSPGVTFNKGIVRVGANFIYNYDVESVEYTYVGEANDKYLYYFEGLFMYTKSNANIVGLIDNRRYERNYYGVGAQFELKSGRISFYNDFKYLGGNFNNFEGPMEITKVNNTRYRGYNYLGTLSLSSNKIDNYLKFSFVSKERALYSFVNTYEEVEGEVGTSTWVSNGKVMRYLEHIKSYNVEYNGYIKRNDYLSNFDYTIGYQRRSVNKDHKFYPSEYSQSYDIDKFYAAINKSFLFSDNKYLNVGVNGGFTNGDGKALTEINPISNIALSINKDLLATDYLFNVSNHSFYGLNAKFSYIVNKAKGFTAWIKADYMIKRLGSNAKLTDALSKQAISFDKDKRGYFDLTIGFNF